MSDLDKLIENLARTIPKFENKIYGVGETRIDLMIKNCIRVLQQCKKQNEYIQELLQEAEKKYISDDYNLGFVERMENMHVGGQIEAYKKILGGKE